MKALKEESRGRNMTSSNENSKIFQHFVLTSFNIKEISQEGGCDRGDLARADGNWLKKRIKLFDDFCYPSIREQTNQNFKWLVLFNINTPVVFKQIIQKYSEWDNFIPVYIEPIKKASSLRRIVRGEIIPKYLKGKTKYLITTRIDSDDALCKDYIEMVQRRFNKQKLQFLNFNNGYIWKYKFNQIYSDKQPSNPFITLIEEVGEIKTVFCWSHPELSKIGPVMEIETEPAWLQLSHEWSTNLPRGVLQSPTKILKLSKDFKIRKNFFLSFWVGTGFYIIRQILNQTRKIRHFLGSTVRKLVRPKNKEER